MTNADMIELCKIAKEANEDWSEMHCDIYNDERAWKKYNERLEFIVKIETALE